MAKRKKQDKIIAKLRRELEITRQELKRTREEIGRYRLGKIKKPVIKETVETRSVKKESQPPKDEKKIWEYSPSLIKKDLSKTLALSTLAIVFELVLYWLNLPN